MVPGGDGAQLVEHVGLRTRRRQGEWLGHPDVGRHDLIEELLEARDADRREHRLMVGSRGPDVATDELGVVEQVAEGSVHGNLRIGLVPPLSMGPESFTAMVRGFPLR